MPKNRVKSKTKLIEEITSKQAYEELEYEKELTKKEDSEIRKKEIQRYCAFMECNGVTLDDIPEKYRYYSAIVLAATKKFYDNPTIIYEWWRNNIIPHHNECNDNVHKHYLYGDYVICNEVFDYNERSEKLYFCDYEGIIQYNILDLNPYMIINHNDYSCLIDELPERVLKYKKVVNEVLKHKHTIRKYMSRFKSNGILNDKNFMMKAIKKDYTNLLYIGNELKDDKDFILEAINSIHYFDDFCPEILGHEILDSESVINVFKQRIFNILSPRLATDTDVIIAIIKMKPEIIYDFFSNVSSNLNIQIDLLKELVKNDRNIILPAVKRNGLALQYASETLKSDREIVLTAVEQNGNALQYADNELRADREIVLAAVRQNGNALQYSANVIRHNLFVTLTAINNIGRYSCLADINEEFASDRLFMFETIRNNGLALRFADFELQSDREIVLVAVRQNGEALRYACDDLRNDREIVLAAIKQNGEALQYACDDFRNDREIVLAAIKQNGKALQYASNPLKSNVFFVLSATKINYEAFQYASEELKNDREVVRAAVNICDDIWWHIGRTLYAEIIRESHLACEYLAFYSYGDDDVDVNFINEELVGCSYSRLRNGFLILIHCPNRNIYYEEGEYTIGAALEGYIQLLQRYEEYYDDIPLILAALGDMEIAIDLRLQFCTNVMKSIIKQNCKALYHSCIDVYRSDKEIILEAVKQNGYMLQETSEELRSDRIIVLVAVEQNGGALQYASEELKNDIEIVQTALKNCKWDIDYILKNVGKELWNNTEFVSSVVNKYGLALQYASEELRSDRIIVLAAVKQNGGALEYASEELKNDIEIVQTALKNCKWDIDHILKNVGKELWNNTEFVSSVVNKYGLALQYAGVELRKDREIVHAAVRNTGRALQYASDILKNDMYVALLALKTYIAAIKYMKEETIKIIISSFSYKRLMDFIENLGKIKYEIRDVYDYVRECIIDALQEYTDSNTD